MVGQVLPNRQLGQPGHRLAVSAPSGRRSGLVVLAIAALAVVFAMLLLSAAAFDTGAGPCADGASTESCCIASSLDAFAIDACRDLR